MRRTLILLFLLAAVALSTGVVLPSLESSQSEPEIAPDIPGNSQDTLDCETLRKLYHSNQLGEWNSVDYEDNNQDTYNDYVDSGQGWSHEHAVDDSWLVSASENKHERLERSYYYQSYDNEEPQVYKVPASKAEILYSRIKNILIRDDNAYYVYDTRMTTTNPFDYVQNKYNCLYNAMSRTSSHKGPITDDKSQRNYDALETMDETSPMVTQVKPKRYDDSEGGEKEIPDNLIFNDGEKSSEVQKKLFSFWSRLQALSHKGRQLPTRRHTFVYYGPEGTQDGSLTAETRASHLRPPGQPLRWG